MSYTMGEVAKRFGVQNNTVRRWAKEYFHDFMSVGARPQDGGHHRFDDSDLAIFATWVRLQAEGKTVEDALAYLRTGERDMPPEEPLTEGQKEMVMSQVLIQNKQLKHQIEELENEIETIRSELNQKNQEVASEKARGNIMEQQYQTAQKRVEELIVELALLKRQMGQGD